ncbi:MAG: hypothetical protein EOO06_00855 [Chitinophagaceae bacterium]|nr:MAG: hypothetical protein EOO06_00855 [Chitinophagaceae bacterium]
MIIQLADGFNGSTMNFDSFPLQIDGDCVKLRCSDDGKHYLIKWTTKKDYDQAIINALGETK